MRSRWIGLRLAGAAVVLLCGQLAVSADVATSGAMTAHGMLGPDTLAPSGGGTLTPTPTGKPRAAFTDDSALLTLYQAGPDGTYFSSTTPPFASGTARYEGQANATTLKNDGEMPVVAYVSTRDNPAGDVYIQSTGIDGGTPVRVTCDGSAKSHPAVMVAAGKIWIAYASDAPGSTNPGHTNIWYTTMDAPSGTLLTAPGSGCPALVAPPTELASQQGDNTWPAWIGAQGVSDGVVANALVYASTRDNPLGDIYEQCAGTCQDYSDALVAGPSTNANRRTFGPNNQVGNTQPTIANDGDDPAELLVTTTQYRPDGSLASTMLPDPDQMSTSATLSSLWAADPPQSSQAAFSDGCFESDGSCVPQPRIAYVSTASDPYGDVLMQSVNFPGDLTVTDTPIQVTETPGIAEADPSFAPTGYETMSGVYVSARAETAGISTAVAADGSGRQPFITAADNFDYSQPAYSPDGTKIAYSAKTTMSSESPDSRVIRIANANGTGTPIQLESQPAEVNGEGVTVVDTEPAWSPDGSKIAFTRIEQSDTPSTTVMWASVPTGSTPSAPHQVTPGGSNQPRDMDPSWSPDGKDLVLTRSLHEADVSVQLAPGDGDYLATVQNLADTTADNVTVTIAVAPPPADSQGLQLSVQSAPSGADCATTSGARSIICTFAFIGALSEPQQIDVQVSDFGSDTASGTYQIKAAASVPAGDTNLANNSDTSTVQEGTGDTYTVSTPGVGSGQYRDGWLSSTALRDDNSGRTYWNPALYVVNATTGDGGPITTSGCAGTPCVVAGRSPAWSPTSNQVAYDDSGMLNLLTLPASIPANPSNLTASKNTALIGYSTYTSSTKTATAARKTITAAHDPAWSSDGSQLYFTGLPATQPDNAGIYAIDADGTKLRTVAQQPQPETEPSVQPTGADLAVTVVPSSSPAYVGGPFTLSVIVTNKGPSAAAGGTLTVSLPPTLEPAAASCLTTGTCTIGALATGAHQTFTVIVTPIAVGNPAHNYTAAITATITPGAPDPVAANNTITLPLPVKQPTLRMLPSVGPPGFVTLAYGENFPPGDKVQVIWKPGINSYSGPFTVAADGTLRVPMLIVRRDQLGTRLAVATSTKQLFSPVTAPMLVVPRSESPPRFLGRS